MCSHQDTNLGPPRMALPAQHNRPSDRTFHANRRKFLVHTNMKRKINTNRQYILKPSNRREKNVYRPENIIQSISTKNSANRREFSSSQK